MNRLAALNNTVKSKVFSPSKMPPAFKGFWLGMCASAFFAVLNVVIAENTAGLFLSLLGVTFSFATFAFLLAKYNAYAKAITGLRVLQVFPFFCFFIFLFYVARGWTYYISRDADLMFSVGVNDPDASMGQAIAWVNVYVVLMFSSYLVFVQKKSKLVSCIFDFIISPRSYGSALSGFAGASLVIVPAMGMVGVLAVLYFSRMDDGFGLFHNYFVSLPYTFTAATLMGWCIFSESKRTQLPLMFAIGIVLVGFLFVGILIGREISSFRGYYLAPLGFFALYYCCKFKSVVPFAIGLVLFLPLLGLLGSTRYVELKYAGDEISGVIQERMELGPLGLIVAPYLSGGGDFTCADIYASVISNPPRYRPYGMSYFYILAHPIPRPLWPSKPELGFLTDQDAFLSVHLPNGSVQKLPYYAGIVGEFDLEGGKLFIVFGAFLVGMFLGYIDSSLRGISARDARIATAFGAVLVFISFFAVRSAPYQIAVYAAFIGAGVFIETRLIGILSGGRRNE